MLAVTILVDGIDALVCNNKAVIDYSKDPPNPDSDMRQTRAQPTSPAYTVACHQPGTITCDAARSRVGGTARGCGGGHAKILRGEFHYLEVVAKPTTNECLRLGSLVGFQQQQWQKPAVATTQLRWGFSPLMRSTVPIPCACHVHCVHMRSPHSPFFLLCKHHPPHHLCHDHTTSQLGLASGWKP